MYTLEYTVEVADYLQTLRGYDRKRILNTIDQQLTQLPTEQTRNKKILVGLKPPWEHDEPIWELRIGQYRVFYDVDEAEERVVIRAVRKKRPNQTTEEIL